MTGERAASDPITVEVILALPEGATVRTYDFDPPVTVADALRRAAADPAFPAFDPLTAAAGVFGRIVRAERPLGPGDRLEIYRPLLCDPKTARRTRARNAKGR